jgi:hypothetical protein
VFGFAEWDSWLSFVLEASLSLAVLVGLIFIVRRVNAKGEADRQRYLQARNSQATPVKQPMPTDMQAQSTESPPGGDAGRET